MAVSMMGIRLRWPLRIKKQPSVDTAEILFP